MPKHSPSIKGATATLTYSAGTIDTMLDCRVGNHKPEPEIDPMFFKIDDAVKRFYGEEDANT